MCQKEARSHNLKHGVRQSLDAHWAAAGLPLPDALLNKALVRLMPDRGSLGNVILH